MKPNLLVCGLLAALLLAVPVAAQEAPTLLKPGGLPVGEPETLLPQGAAAHARAPNLAQFLNALDELVMTFVPEKAVPPELQPLLKDPHPFLAFVGLNTLKQPLTPELIAQAFGIAADKPVTLTLYPFEPMQGFILSVPMGNPEALTKLLLNAMRARQFVPEALGDEHGFYMVGTNADLPNELHILCSPDRAYICTSPALALSLAKAATPRLAAGGLVPRVLQQYGQDDLSVTFDAEPFKPLLGALTQQYSRIPPQVIARVRRDILRDIPPQQRNSLNLQLRFRLGISSVDQGLDYLEALASGTYEVLFAGLAEQLQALDGVSVSVRLGKRFQRLNLAVYSPEIKSAAAAQALPLDELRQVIAKLPGSRASLYLRGREPLGAPSALCARWLESLKAKFLEKRLPATCLEAVEGYLHTAKLIQPLESQVPWVLETSFTPPSTRPAPKTVYEYLTAHLGDLFEDETLRVLPAQDETILEKHFAALAADTTQNELAGRDLLQRLTGRAPFYDFASRYRAVPTEGKAKKLVLENVYTTRGGLFGYAEHELINRRFLYYCRQGDCLYLQASTTRGDIWLNKVDAVPVQPVPPALSELLDQVPKGANSIQTLRLLGQLGEGIAELTRFEDLLHAEVAGYLTKVEAAIAANRADPDRLQAALMDLEIPLPVMTLNATPEGKYYCLLLGGLRYPRPKVMPLVAGLLKDFLAQADKVGGVVAFERTRDGQYEAGVVQSTEALGLLVKTAVNNFWQTYRSDPQDMERLQRALIVPGDGHPQWEEMLMKNVLWDFMIQPEREGGVGLPERGDLPRPPAPRRR